MRSLMFLFLAAAGATTAVAQVPEREPVTDPEHLAALGLPADAEGIFRIPPPPQSPPGTIRSGVGAEPIAGGQRWSLVMGSEFVGTHDGFVRGTTSMGGEMYCAAGSPQNLARARIPLPSDQRLQYLDVWFYDASATQDLQVQLFEDCSPALSAGAPTSTVIGTYQTSGSSGYGGSFIALPAFYPNGFLCSYYLQANFGSGCPAGWDLRLNGVRVLWAKGNGGL